MVVIEGQLAAIDGVDGSPTEDGKRVSRPSAYDPCPGVRRKYNKLSHEAEIIQQRLDYARHELKEVGGRNRGERRGRREYDEAIEKLRAGVIARVIAEF